MHNPGLHNAVANFCREAFRVLTEALARLPDPPTRLATKVTIEGKGRHSYTQVPEVHWPIFVLQLGRHLAELPTYRKAIVALESDERIAVHLNTLVGTAAGRSRVTAEGCLTSVLLRFLAATGEPTWDEAVFNRVYAAIEDSFYRDTVALRFSAPADGLDMDQDRLDLGDGLSIVRLTQAQLEATLAVAPEPFSPYSHAAAFAEFAFELTVTVPKVVGALEPSADLGTIPSEIARQRFSEALAALRLFKTGDLRFNYISSEADAAFSGSAALWHFGRASGFPGTYQLTAAEAPAFLDLWALFREVGRLRRPQLHLATSRLGFGGERRDPVDKLVDFIIAFEALLLGDKQELRYKLAMRVSHLLAESAQERVRIFDTMAEAYKQRNNIVHGGHPQSSVTIAGERYEFGRLVQSTEECLRRTIREFLVRGKAQTEQQIRDDIDQSIVTAGAVP